MTLQTMRSGGAQHPEEIMNFLANQLTFTPGIINKIMGDAKVLQQTVPDMTVKASIGHMLLQKSGAEMAYPGRITAASNVTIGSNASGNPRIDAIVAYIDLGASPNTDISNVLKLVAVAGTPAGSPSAPTDANIVSAIGASNPFLRLANVAVANGAISIVTANITDTRTEVVFYNAANSDGWIPCQCVIPTRASLDTPAATAVLTFAGIDLTQTPGVSVGCKIKFLQNGALVYGIVTAIAFSTDTTVTIYLGTDYTVGDTATYPISGFFYSRDKAPQGFPLDPNKWSVQVFDNQNRVQASATQNVWYNTNSALSLVVPIGLWRLQYQVCAEGDGSAVKTTLSTANNSESDADFTSHHQIGAGAMLTMQGKEKFITLAAKATYYLNSMTPNGAATINVYGGFAKTIIRAVCQYL